MNRQIGEYAMFMSAKAILPFYHILRVSITAIWKAVRTAIDVPGLALRLRGWLGDATPWETDRVDKRSGDS